MPAIVTANAEVGRNPQHFVDVTGAGGDIVDDAVVAIEIDFHLAIGVEVSLPVLGDAVVLKGALPQTARYTLSSRQHTL